VGVTAELASAVRLPAFDFLTEQRPPLPSPGQRIRVLRIFAPRATNVPIVIREKPR
jgi:hypothetical protein